MRCFYHPDREAVGLCKNCQKALCAESAIDVGDGLSCPGRCELRVERRNASLGRADEMAAGWDSFMGAGMLVVGSIFVALGLWFSTDDLWSGALFACLGLAFLATPAREFSARSRRRAI
jgi:hypothetical protein